MTEYNAGPIERLMMLGSPDRNGRATPFDRGPIVESARVIAVDEVKWIISLKTLYTHRTVENVEVPGAGADGSACVDFPQVGDVYTIVFPSDDYTPHLLNSRPVYRAGDGARGGRHGVKSGDKLLAGPNGNKVHVSRSGFVDIGADPITRRMYVPLLHQIKDFFESYFLAGAGGGLAWESSRGEQNRTSMIWELKRRSDESAVVRLSAGDMENVEGLSGTSVYHTEIIDSGGQVVAHLAYDLSGNILVEGNGDSLHSVDGDLVLSGSTTALTTTKDQAAGRSSVRTSAAGGVELASAVEPALKGSTAIALLAELVSAVDQAATSFIAAFPTVGAPAGPGAAEAAKASQQLSSSLKSISARLSTLLAQDVKLS